jgi:hypothetical protein
MSGLRGLSRFHSDIGLYSTWRHGSHRKWTRESNVVSNAIPEGPTSREASIPFNNNNACEMSEHDHDHVEPCLSLSSVPDSGAGSLLGGP